MANKVNITFGGYVNIPYSQVGAARTTYENIATTYDVEPMSFQFVTKHCNDDNVRIQFTYRKLNFLYVNLGAFFTTWGTITDTYNILGGIAKIFNIDN